MHNSLIVDIMGMRFSGYIKIPQTGVYRFYVMHNDEIE